MICAKQVFKCFKWVERAGDALTGAAGPVFVFLAVVLLSAGAFCFCECHPARSRRTVLTSPSVEVILPSLRWPLLSAPLCVLIATNMFAHYYYVCTVPPGFVSDAPRPRGSGLLWAKKRRSARNRALTGVRWTEELNVTKASISKCKRCGEIRPEVCT